MPLAVRNAPALFQTLMDKLLRDKRDFTRAYMDEVIIFSNTIDDHIRHIRTVLETLRRNELTANPAKCKWGGQQIEFLGQIVGKGVHLIPGKRAGAIANYKKPVTKNGLWSFLGSVSYYRRFLIRFAKFSSFVTRDCKGGSHQDPLVKGHGESLHHHM